MPPQYAKEPTRMSAIVGYLVFRYSALLQPPALV